MAGYRPTALTQGVANDLAIFRCRSDGACEIAASQVVPGASADRRRASAGPMLPRFTKDTSPIS
jgi:hypothetical protein